MKQSEIREKVIYAIYDVLLFEQSGNDYDPREILAGLFEESFESIPLFARELFIKASINKQEIIALVEPKLNRWSFDRLNLLVQAALIVAVAERNYIQDTDRKVVINEIVEFVKNYADSQDYRFVNAVLDKVLI